MRYSCDQLRVLTYLMVMTSQPVIRHASRQTASIAWVLPGVRDGLAQSQTICDVSVLLPEEQALVRQSKLPGDSNL